MQQQCPSHQASKTHNPSSKLKSIPVSNIKLTDRFWAPRLQNILATSSKKVRDIVDPITNACDAEKAYLHSKVSDAGEIDGEYTIPKAHTQVDLSSSIAALKWAWYKLQMDAQCQYADYMEYALYNSLLPLISQDARSFSNINTYFSNDPINPGTRFDKKSPSPDLTAILASMPGYIYSTTTDTIWVHQFAANESILTLPEGEKVSILQRTRYPWDGNVIIEILDDCELCLKVRIPIWCQHNVEININGDLYTQSVTPGTYVSIKRSWSVGDSVCIQFPLPVRKIKTHPDATEDTNQVALMRGPILYCLESQDQPNIDLFSMVIPSNQTFTSSFQPRLLNGIQTIEIPVILAANTENPDETQERGKGDSEIPRDKIKSLVAIPYFAWGNREPGQMLVWLSECDEVDIQGS